MYKRWILLAILAVLLGALLDHEDGYEDAQVAHVKAGPGQTVPLK